MWDGNVAAAALPLLPDRSSSVLPTPGLFLFLLSYSAASPACLQVLLVAHPLYAILGFHPPMLSASRAVGSC